MWVALTVTGAQASLAVGAVQLATAELPGTVRLMFAGQLEMSGAATSPGHGSAPTVTVKLQVEVLFAASFAV